MRNPAVAAFVCALFLLGPAAREAAALDDPVTWYRDARDPAPPVRGLQVPCGKLGIFQFVRGPLTECDGALECGNETPPIYPSPGDGEELHRAATTPASSWLPCAGGSCFAGIEPPPSALPTGSWAAVIDWHQPHGWSVGWTLLQVANDDPLHPATPAVLYNLDDPTLAAQGYSLRGATDVHLLKKLCEIAEAVDEGPGVSPPAVINMSFGRRFRPIDAKSSSTCNRQLLSCQIAQVETRLLLGDATDMSTDVSGARSTLVAAAGNHREWIFPAALDTVLPSGSLQLEAFGRGVVERSWETPDYGARAQGIFPGYGLCIEQTAGARQSATEWAAPAGTSYAAAILSGWLAQVGRPALVDALRGAAWFPKRTCPATGSCTYVLAHGGRAFGANPRVDALINRALDPAAVKCGIEPPVTPGQVMELKVMTLAQPDALPKDSFIDIVGELKLPTPDSRPCVPCQSMSSISGAAARGGGKAAARAVIDLSAVDPVPPPFPYPLQAQAQIAALYLRTGDTYLALAPQSGELNDLKDGTIHQLWLPDLRASIPSGTQPSLIFIMKSDQPELLGRPFWMSVPILVRY